MRTRNSDAAFSDSLNVHETSSTALSLPTIGVMTLGVTKRLSLIPGAGHGLFSTMHLPRGCIIGEYTGTIRPAAECDPAWAMHTSKGPDFMIDASTSRRTCLVRFVNEASPPQCNCITRELYADGRVFLVAKHPIPAETELLYHYGYDYPRTTYALRARGHRQRPPPPTEPLGDNGTASRDPADRAPRARGQAGAPHNHTPHTQPVPDTGNGRDNHSTTGTTDRKANPPTTKPAPTPTPQHTAMSLQHITPQAAAKHLVIEEQQRTDALKMVNYVLAHLRHAKNKDGKKLYRICLKAARNYCRQTKRITTKKGLAHADLVEALHRRMPPHPKRSRDDQERASGLIKEMHQKLQDNLTTRRIRDIATAPDCPRNYIDLTNEPRTRTQLRDLIRQQPDLTWQQPEHTWPQPARIRQQPGLIRQQPAHKEDPLCYCGGGYGTPECYCGGFETRGGLVRNADGDDQERSDTGSDRNGGPPWTEDDNNTDDRGSEPDHDTDDHDSEPDQPTPPGGPAAPTREPSWRIIKTTTAKRAGDPSPAHANNKRHTTHIISRRQHNQRHEDEEDEGDEGEEDGEDSESKDEGDAAQADHGQQPEPPTAQRRSILAGHLTRHEDVTAADKDQRGKFASLTKKFAADTSPATRAAHATFNAAFTNYLAEFTAYAHEAHNMDIQL